MWVVIRCFSVGKMPETLVNSSSSRLRKLKNGINMWSFFDYLLAWRLESSMFKRPSLSGGLLVLTIFVPVFSARLYCF